MTTFKAMEIKPHHGPKDVQEFIGEGPRAWPGGLGGYLVVTVGNDAKPIILDDGDFVIKNSDGSVGKIEKGGLVINA